MNLPPEFSARITFTFREYDSPKEKYFIFGEDGHRRVPMRMDGVEGLNTVGMWVDDAPKVFRLGDQTDVKCLLLAPELFSTSLQSGVAFELWDGKFCASGVVLERYRR